MFYPLYKIHVDIQVYYKNIIYLIEKFKRSKERRGTWSIVTIILCYNVTEELHFSVRVTTIKYQSRSNSSILILLLLGIHKVTIYSLFKI